MQQYNLVDNILNLKVKKSPLIIRIVMFFLTFAFFVFPVLGTIVGILAGSGLQFSYLIGIGIFSLIGFYLRRVSLWNTYGEETIEIFENKIIYEANYGWFKDGKKEVFIFSNPIFHALLADYEDNERVLLIVSGNVEIESVVKIPLHQLEELIEVLNVKYNKS